MCLGSFFRKHKRCCFDKLMYVRSIGFKLTESTRYTICSIGLMSITLQTTKYLTQKHKVYTQQQSPALQQVRNNSYLTDRDKTGHSYRENSEISNRLFNSVNPSLQYGRPYRCNARKLVKEWIKPIFQPLYTKGGC